MNKSDRIFVAGHNGLVGSAVIRRLKQKGFENVVTRTRAELDLLNQVQVNAFFASTPIDVVVVCAAKVGGIFANKSFPADFLYENIVIASNLVHAAAYSNVKKLLYLGSSCIYPKLATQPIAESELLAGPLEPTNEGYAVAKIAGLKLCEYFSRQYKKDFISAMPTNLYGPYDNFHPDHSHVIPGMMRRFHEAKVEKKSSVSVWGTGNCKREFLHVDDLSEALLYLLDNYSDTKTINVGTGQDCTIKELAYTIKKVVGYPGEILFDTSKPDGPPRKLLNVERINALGWQAQISLEDGLRETYAWALHNKVFEIDPKHRYLARSEENAASA